MFFGRGQHPQCLGQEEAISLIRLFEFRRQVGHESAHPAIMFLAVSKKEHFMTGMKIDKYPPPGRNGDKVAEVPVNEDALDEVLSQPVIVEPTILLHRQEGEMAHEGSGEHADTGSMGHSILRVDLDPERPLLGDPFLKIKPHRPSPSNCRTLVSAQIDICSV